MCKLFHIAIKTIIMNLLKTFSLDTTRHRLTQMKKKQISTLGRNSTLAFKIDTSSDIRIHSLRKICANSCLGLSSSFYPTLISQLPPGTLLGSVHADVPYPPLFWRRILQKGEGFPPSLSIVKTGYTHFCF